MRDGGHVQIKEGFSLSSCLLSSFWASLRYLLAIAPPLQPPLEPSSLANPPLVHWLRLPGRKTDAPATTYVTHARTSSSTSEGVILLRPRKVWERYLWERVGAPKLHPFGIIHCFHALPYKEACANGYSGHALAARMHPLPHVHS